MSPEDCITALDNALAEAGEDIILRRVTGTGASAAYTDVTCRAFVVGKAVQDLVSGIMQTHFEVIISPTQIKHAGWPNLPITGTPPFNPDPQVPTILDVVITDGRPRSVTFVDAARMGTQVVRINMRITG